MQIVIDQNNSDESDANNRLELYGVQDYQVTETGVLLFWPGDSALGNYETIVEGEIVAGTDEALLWMETYADFLADQSFVKNTVVVESPAFPLLSDTLDSLCPEVQDRITVIAADEDVHLNEYDFFETP